MTMNMLMKVMPISDLDQNDSRRWKKPRYGYEQHLWDDGYVSVSFREWWELCKEKDIEQFEEPSVQQQERNYGRWLPRHIRVCPNNNELAPSKRKTTCVDTTNDSHAQPSTGSAVTGCNCCGITHRRQHCPNRAPETEPKSALVHARPKINPKSHPT
uniref:uncharacterized protein LOC105353000 n=1 Tax=Fragaria vesca subsp. vesca TaxID=101020 RepID=UPI0005C849AA|nr:PREDICTED: uncharacterized protein LOC105353000 [Fragaria vesca subsp. vesca]